MADLASILKDPNYINANAATKQAIFDKWAPQDPNYANANGATQQAIRQKFGVGLSAPELPPELQPVTQQTAPEPELTTGQKVYKAVRPYVAPIVEAGGAIAGGLLGGTAGTFGAGPLGTAVGGVAGAGLGYGIAREGLEAADVAMGMKQPRQGLQHVTEPVRNVIEGATFEAGGRAVVPVLGAAVNKMAAYGPRGKAAALARNALGPDAPQVVNALRAAEEGVSPAQATAGVNSPTWQALVERAARRDPRAVNAMITAQDEVSLNALSRAAGGGTAAETRATAENMKNAVTTTTTPVREAALARANLGKQVAEYEGAAAKLGSEAAEKVAEVRRLMNAGNIAEASARLDLIKKGLPVGFTKYTYKGELAQKAFNEWSDAAANASLDLGQGARFSQAAADSLRSVGIKPLKGGDLSARIRAISNNPSFAGDDVLEGAVRNVADDIAKWTDSGGIIDAQALDAIRKNSVNAAIAKLRPGMDATAQRNLASKVLNDIKPMLVNAIEESGGKGYGKYLADYSAGMRQISERKLTGEAQRLWKTNKDEFVRLVQNESPETVEKFLGSGSYNIAKELSDDTLSTLRTEAEKVLRNANIKSQVEGGQDALKELLLQHMNKLRIPSYFSAVGATTNKALNILENKIGRKTMDVLTESFKDPKRTADLLETLPLTERNRVLSILKDPAKWGISVPVGVKNVAENNERKPSNSFVVRSENAMTP